LPSGPNAWPLAFLVSSTNRLTLPSDPILYALLLGMSLKNTSPLAFAAGPFRKREAVGNELPDFAGKQDLLQLLRAEPGLHRRGPIFPEPLHGFRKELRSVLPVVASLTPFVVHFVAGESQRPLHFLIGHPPIAAVDVLIGTAVLQENSDGFGLILADQRGIDIAAAEANVRADGAEHAPETIRPLPGRG